MAIGSDLSIPAMSDEPEQIFFRTGAPHGFAGKGDE